MYNSFEINVNNELKKALDTAGKMALGALESFNRLNNMVTSGSKGSNMNIS